MNAVCLVPAFLKLFLTKSNSSIIRRSFLFLMDFIAFAMQCSCVAIALASKFLKNESSFSIRSTSTSIDENLLNRHKRQDDLLMSSTESIFSPDNLLTSNIDNSSNSYPHQNLQMILAGFHIEWELPVALILVSLAWFVFFSFVKLIRLILFFLIQVGKFRRSWHQIRWPNDYSNETVERKYYRYSFKNVDRH